MRTFYTAWGPSWQQGECEEGKAKWEANNTWIALDQSQCVIINNINNTSKTELAQWCGGSIVGLIGWRMEWRGCNIGSRIILSIIFSSTIIFGSTTIFGSIIILGSIIIFGIVIICNRNALPSYIALHLPLNIIICPKHVTGYWLI